MQTKPQETDDPGTDLTGPEPAGKLGIFSSMHRPFSGPDYMGREDESQSSLGRHYMPSFRLTQMGGSPVSMEDGFKWFSALQVPSLQQHMASHLLDSRMVNFWAKALHKEVFPVPGGPAMRRSEHVSKSARQQFPNMFALSAKYK